MSTSLDTTRVISAAADFATQVFLPLTERMTAVMIVNTEADFVSVGEYFLESGDSAIFWPDGTSIALRGDRDFGDEA